MYTPKHFKPASDEEVRDFIRQHSFGIMVSHGESMIATHIPMELSTDGSMLSGHIAKANPQREHLREGNEVLAIFQGPHTYISSSWYNHENVPTWNYMAAHVYGRVRIVIGDELYRRLKIMVDRYEKLSHNPIDIENFSEQYIEKQMNAIVGFDISIDKLEASFKLSQNRDEVNRHSIVSHLEEQEDADAKRIALEIKKRTNTPTAVKRYEYYFT